MGWRPELIAVEWNNVDVAVFERLPREPENCYFIVEAKRLGQGVEGALQQAQGYLNVLGISRNVVITDGVRYRLFDSSDDYNSLAYANLVKLKQSAINLFQQLRK